MEERAVEYVQFEKNRLKVSFCCVSPCNFSFKIAHNSSSIHPKKPVDLCDYGTYFAVKKLDFMGIWGPKGL